MTRDERSSLEALDAKGHGLRVEFLRQGDRWAHCVWAVGPDAAWPLLASVEGDDQQAFPPSPPLQQLDFQQLRPDVQAALLLGMAGRNHWSVGIEAHRVQPHLRFDVACRCRPDGQERLVSTYVPLAAWKQTAAGVWMGEVGGSHWELAAVAGIASSLTDNAGLAAPNIVFSAVVDPAASTQRWCYELRARTGGS